MMRIPVTLSLGSRILASTLLVWLAGFASALGQTYDFTAATAHLESNLDLYGPRGVVAIVEQRGRGEILRFEGTTGAPAIQLTDSTKVAIASATKWYSGAIVLKVAELGYFRLDDRVGRYLPIFDQQGKGDITIRQCFAMNSGLSLRDPDYEIDSTLTLAQSVDLIASNAPIIFPPGTQLDYEGDGMQTVGRICEVVTGKDWRTLARELLFEPLGMTNSDYETFGLNPAIAGGARSTAQDYLKFLRMILNNGLAENGRAILASRSVQEFFQNQTYNLPEYYSPAPASLFYAYNQRPDYGMGSWIFAQNPTNLVVEEVASPGAFGTCPWVDRKRGLCGIIFMLGLTGFQTTGNNDLRFMDAIRREIDAKGLPPQSSSGPLTVTRIGDYLRIDWGGTGSLQSSTNLSDWIPLPWSYSPFLETTRSSTAPSQFYRVVR